MNTNSGIFTSGNKPEFDRRICRALEGPYVNDILGLIIAIVTAHEFLISVLVRYCFIFVPNFVKISKRVLELLSGHELHTEI